MPKPIRKRRRKSWQMIVTFALVLLVVFYIGYQAYRSIYSDVKLESAVMHSVYESIETEGLVFRSETPLASVEEKGSPYYSVENGTRVANKSVIASVYKDAESGRIEQQIRDIDEQINAFKSIMADAGSGRLILDVINKQFSENLLQLIRDTETGNLSDVDDFSFDLLALLSKKALITGKDVDFTDKIAELQSEKKALKARYSPPVSQIKAPTAGYFVDHIDGYENILSIDKRSDLDVATLKKYMNSKPERKKSASGKIVSGYEWYMACIVPDSYYNMLGVDRKLTLRLPFVLDDPVPVTVESVTKDKKSNGKMVVVFACDQMNAKLSAIRRETVEIQLVEHTGLKVPKRAVVVKDGQTGVYIRSGNVVAFRRIKQQYSQPADYVICEVIEKKGYLQMYDDIVIGGKGLYDGKIIH